MAAVLYILIGFVIGWIGKNCNPREKNGRFKKKKWYHKIGSCR